MNRAVKWKLEELTMRDVGIVLLLTIKHQPLGFKEYKEYSFDNNELPDPWPLLKYGLRLFYIFKSDSQKARLPELRKPKDPYRVVSFHRFNGRFAYDHERECYRPVKIATTGSATMRNIWAKVESHRIRRAWDQARQLLQGENGGPPTLAEELE